MFSSYFKIFYKILRNSYIRLLASLKNSEISPKCCFPFLCFQFCDSFVLLQLTTDPINSWQRAIELNKFAVFDSTKNVCEKAIKM